MRSAYIGVDVAIAKGKHLPVVVCVSEDNRIVPQRLRNLDLAPPRGAGNLAVLDPAWCQEFAFEARRYILRVCERLQLIPRRIGIDAPSSPRAASARRRSAEIALDYAGISCFATPSAGDFELVREKVRQHLVSGGSEARCPHSNQLWMLAGFSIFQALAEVAECLEVFPQATIRIAGSGEIHKSQPGAVARQLAAASTYTGWPNGSPGDPVLNEIGWGTMHDQLDAYLSSWVASLSEGQRTAFGHPPDDAIWIPKLQRPDLQGVPVFSVAPVRADRFMRNVEPTIPAASGVICPGCGQYRFRRWPWGWDGHAAYKCTGLVASTPEGRKAEFRRKFAEHF